MSSSAASGSAGFSSLEPPVLLLLGEKLLPDQRTVRDQQDAHTILYGCVCVFQSEVHGAVLLPAPAGRGLSAHLEPDRRPKRQSCESQ